MHSGRKTAISETGPHAGHMSAFWEITSPAAGRVAGDLGSGFA
jgi:hypothetical protein